MKILFAAVSVFLSMALFAQEVSPSRPLDELVAGESAWQMTAAQFEQQFQKTRFDWLSDKKDQARFFGPGLSLWEGSVKLNEAIIEFTPEGNPSRMTFSIFSRGDSDQLAHTRDQFESQIKMLRDTISKRLAVASTERGKDKTSAVAAEGFVWMKSPTAYLLEYSYQREVKSRDIEFRPEFIRLRVARVGGKSAAPAATAATGVSKASLAANLKRAENGDVYISNVPMVDQGPKGYCAVATAERVFKYYGIPVDQHEMAQVADTGAGGGTSPDKMYEALNKLEGRLRVRVRVIENWDFKKFMDEVADYNKEASAPKNRRSMPVRAGTSFM